ncbi:MAG: DUF805 domain-containing protein [Acidobacteriota bacterium]
MEWYLLAWKRYAQFAGRSRRKEYWMFTLIHSLIIAGLYLAGLALTLVLVGIPLLVLTWLYSLAAVIPCFACSVRRLHDVGKSGWWLLLGLIPIIGGIVLIVWQATDSQIGDNPYGPNPKLPAAAPVTG